MTLAVVADEGGKLAHGMGDGVVELGEFALERLRRAVGHIGPPEARRRGFGVCDLIRCFGARGPRGQVATDHPLDAKNLTLHETFPRNP